MRALSPRRIRRNNTSTHKNKENDPPSNPHVGDFHPDHRAQLVQEQSMSSMNLMISSYEEAEKTRRKRDTKTRKQNRTGEATATARGAGTPPRPTSKASSRGGLRSRTPTPIRSPLSSTRDPTRRPLQSTTPLAPSFHGKLNHYQTHNENNADTATGTNTGKGKGKGTKINIVVRKTNEKHNSKKQSKSNKDHSKNGIDLKSVEPSLVKQKRDRKIDRAHLERKGKDKVQYQNQRKINQDKLSNVPNGVSLLEEPPKRQVQVQAEGPDTSPAFEEAGITPAYAYKDADSGLLRISIAPPQPHEIQINNGHQGGDTNMSASMSICSASASASIISSRSNSLLPTASSTSGSALTSAPALYPIAINGGGVGVYTDPRTFAKGGINAISENRHQVLRVTGRNISFPWNFGNGTFSSEKNKNTSILRRTNREGDDEVDDMALAADVSVRGSLSFDREEDLEQGLKKALRGELNYPVEHDRFPNDDDGETKLFSPWKIWEAVHNSVVRFREREDTIVGNRSGSTDAIFESVNGRRSSSGSVLSDDGKKKVVRSLPSRPISSKRKARISSVYNEDDFDFVLILQPREVYRYWADLLDFREERGYEVRPQSKNLMSDGGKAKTDSNSSTRNSENSRKRRRNDAFTADHQNTNENGNLAFDSDWCNEIPFNIGCGPTRIASVDARGQRVFSHGTSLFDRAIQTKTPPMTRKPAEKNSAGSSSTLASAGNNMEKRSPVRSAARRIRRSLNRFSPNRNRRRLSPRETPPSSTRRRWGNNNAINSNSRTPFSPPIRALRKTSPKRGGGRNQGIPYPFKDHSDKNKEEERQRKRARKANPNSLEIEDIPNQLIPRGIAARTARSNGMTEFLWALERGFVVRRHRAGYEPVFVKLISSDGGDTIQYKFIDPGDAHIALKGQNVRYNKTNRRGVYDDPLIPDESSWANIEKGDKDLSQHHFLPDFKKSVVDIATKTLHGGSLRAADVIAVHRATHVNPLSAAKEQGTSTLQECKDHITREFQKAIKEGLTSGQKEELVNKTLLREPVNIRSFSLVMRSGNLVPLVSNTSLQIDSENWHTGQASESSFRYLDIETATNGEYWMLFRGFLLLQRDAMSGRFAAQRAGGFGSMYNNYETMHQLKAAEKNANENNPVPMFNEPEEKGRIKKLISCMAKSDDKDKHTHNPKAPPSDFFLGFRSPGTQIWGRLRQAGLETDRIYALDTRRVMIKVRCPADRLMDVAEVLRLKMKTNDGYYATFREDMIEAFQIADDSESCLSKQGSSLFRSSDRQRILDFIINSRIRDSGAQLSGHNDLGKNIMCRAPIHMHAKLEAIYDVWVHFYRKCNWNKGKTSIETNIKDDLIPPPPFLKRLIVGSFYQPLDSVEEYFGEKVALYFAWLEHSSIHLILLSVLGLFAFLCQVVSGRFDHEIRPYFSFIVQIWSFFVLVTWRKRQNSLTYRWGSTNYKEEETPRPQFRGEYKRCDITGEVIAYYPRWKRWLKYLLSVPLTLSITVAALCGILLFYANRDVVLARYFSDPDADGGILYEVNWSLGALNQKEALGAVELSKEHLQDINFWYIVAGAPSLLGLSLPLMNFLLMQISRKMNDFENHETESHYRNGLIVKVIAFRFVTYFAALYYYAYISTGADQATVDNSILRVATSLVIYLTVAHWWSIFLGVYVPLLILRWRLYRGRLKLKTELRSLNVLERIYCNDEKMGAEEAYRIEKTIVNKRILLEQAQSKIWEEMMLPEYDPFFDYVQAIIHFAYVACFSAVFPLTPILVLGNQLINMRLHAYKICRSRRRPLAQKTGGIGVWAQLLHIVTVIAILTNCSLMVLTSSVFDFVRDTYGSLGVLIVIVLWEHIMLLIKYMMESLISPFSSSILDAMKKEDYTKIEERNSNLRDKTKERRSSHGASMISRPRLGRNNSSLFTLSDDDVNRGFHDKKRSFSSRTPASKINTRKASFPPSPATEESSPLLDHYSDDYEDEDSSPTDNTNINIENNGLQHRPHKGGVDVRSMKRSPARSIFFSPFNHFFQNDKYRSPLESEDSNCNHSPNEEDSPSLADMLSTGSFGTSSEVETKSFRTPLKPSMSRAKMEHIATSEQHAAEHRIQKRISSIRERRKTEGSRR
mmetsp:Transcript_25942/g.39750  ORF Transcript_25942/g.39750 Transcript_25942/m.39750 type:complete len:2112 (+) Transcript_25942:199-6534(+)